MIDARNVVRSRWPNLQNDWFVERTRAWAEREGVLALVVFDGRAPDTEDDERVAVLGTGGGTADDWIAEEAERLGREGRRLWLVTSDRGLRERVAAYADRTIGGGTFAGFLEELAPREKWSRGRDGPPPGSDRRR